MVAIESLPLRHSSRINHIEEEGYRFCELTNYFPEPRGHYEEQLRQLQEYDNVATARSIKPPIPMTIASTATLVSRDFGKN